MCDPNITIDTKRLFDLANEIMLATGCLLKNESGPGTCDTQAIRMLLNVADELLELPKMQGDVSEFTV